MLPLIKRNTTLQGDIFYSHFDVQNHHKVIDSILSTALNQKIECKQIPLNDKGRPDFSSYGMDANWTHSKNTCVLVFSFNARVGVDLEFYKKRKHIRLARRFFNREETSLIESLPESQSLELFYKLWCRKEAYYKCFGGSFFEGSLKVSMLNEDSGAYSFWEPDLGVLEERLDYSCCIISAFQ